MPLPPLDQPNPLRDYPIPNLVASSHQFVVVGDVGAYPLRRFVVSGPILIPLFQIIAGVDLAVMASYVHDERGAILLLNNDLGSCCDGRKPLGGVDGEQRFHDPTSYLISQLVSFLFRKPVSDLLSLFRVGTNFLKRDPGGLSPS